MRKLKRTRLGFIMPANDWVIPNKGDDWVMEFGYVLEVIIFIGTSPVNRNYIAETGGKFIRIFPTKGEALDYATKEMNCGQVVFSTTLNELCTIKAHIRDNPFFNTPPLDYKICVC